MEILIESTKRFEADLSELTEAEKASVIKAINDCASLFPAQSAQAYRRLRRSALTSDLNGYQSSLYTLRGSLKLSVILTVDEDPIFGQIIFTLFRVVKRDDLEQAYRDVAESLYRDLQHHRPKIVQLS